MPQYLCNTTNKRKVYFRKDNDQKIEIKCGASEIGKDISVSNLKYLEMHCQDFKNSLGKREFYRAKSKRQIDWSEMPEFVQAEQDRKPVSKTVRDRALETLHDTEAVLGGEVRLKPLTFEKLYRASKSERKQILNELKEKHRKKGRSGPKRVYFMGR